jgi:hypothetical protein
MTISVNEIEHAIQLKQLKPRHLVNIIEEYFKTIDPNYPTTVKEILRYRKGVHFFLQTQEEFNRSLKRTANLVIEFKENGTTAIANSGGVQDIDGLTNAGACMMRIIEKESEFIIECNLNEKETQQLILLKEDFADNKKIGSIVVNSLFRNETFNILIKIFACMASLIIAFSLGNYIEAWRSEAGDFLVNLLTAIFLFFAIDILSGKAKDYLLWQRTNYLFSKLKQLKEIE